MQSPTSKANKIMIIEDDVKKDITVSEKQKWLSILQKIVPLASSLTSALLKRIIFGSLVSVWLALFCYRLYDISAIYSSIILIVSLLPTIILSKYYLILQDIADLTNKVFRFSNEAKQSSQEFVSDFEEIKNIKREDISAFNLITQGKRIFELINLVKSGKNMLGQYINVAVLISPITLILISGALIGLGLLTLVFIITLIIALI